MNKLYQFSIDDGGNGCWILVMPGDDISALQAQADAIISSGGQARIEIDTDTGSQIIYQG